MKANNRTQTASIGGPFPLIFRSGPWVDLAFWIVYGLFWHLIFAPSITIENLAISAILTFWQALASYTHLKFLLEPRGAGKLNLPLYAVGIVLLIVAASCFSGGSVYAFFLTFLSYEATGTYLSSFFDYWVGSIVGGMTMAVAITGSIHLFGRRREQEKREAELEKARTDAELAFLRGQLNPHFLFNALNSIYVLIPRDPDQAQTALGGFSDLLRYQLYRSQEEFVPLTEELEQLRQFVDLSHLRLEEDFVFAMQTPPGLEGQRIPPMLLLPLVENAIKYSPKQGGKVTGIVDVKEQRLHFTLSNNTSLLKLSDPDAGGIGLTNIRRRLDLLFPEDHTFITTEKDGHYTATLEIPLA